MVPGKRVLPVRPHEAFDGRISQEFRTKDPEGGERGVSLLMGRDASTMATEVQCIVFDPKCCKQLLHTTQAIFFPGKTTSAVTRAGRIYLVFLLYGLNLLS